jgi:FMN reductase
MSILLIAGSPSPSSRSSRILQYVGAQLAALDHRTSCLYVTDLPAEALLRADFSHADIQAAKTSVASADAVVIATPIYKAAYSGVLKTFLDLLPKDGLRGKLVLPLATGGSQSHMLALDYALRPVLSALAAKHVLPGIYATEDQVSWSADAGLVLDLAVGRRLDDAVLSLDQALRSAKPLNAAAIHAAVRERSALSGPFGEMVANRFPPEVAQR